MIWNGAMFQVFYVFYKKAGMIGLLMFGTITTMKTQDGTISYHYIRIF